MRVTAEFMMPGPGDALHVALVEVAEQHGGELLSTGDRVWSAPTDAQIANEHEVLEEALRLACLDRAAGAAEDFKRQARERGYGA